MKKVIVGLSAVALLITGCGSSDSEESKQRSAEVECRTKVQMKVADVGYGDFKELTVIKFGDGWKVSGYVDTKNAFGGPAKQRFVCDVDASEKVTNLELP